MGRQELVKANRFNRKHDHTWWAEKKRSGGGGGTFIGGGDADDKMKTRVAIPTPPGFLTIGAAAGIAVTIPFDTVVEPSLNGAITLFAPGTFKVNKDAIYYANVSVFLNCPSEAPTGGTIVQVDLMKNGAVYQNVVFDYTERVGTLHKRFNGADYIRFDEGDSISWAFRGPAGGASYNVFDAYCNIGLGPLR